MRASLLMLALLAISGMNVCQADQPLVGHGHSTACGCGHATTVVVPSCTTVPMGCTTCGHGFGSGCGSNLCNDWPAFYAQLYASFYANNPWYLPAKQQEKAERWARLHGKDAPPPQPLNIPRAQ